MPQPPPQTLGTLPLEQPEGGLGLPCPGWPTWMGRGSVPASSQRAARGCPKSALLQPEPACPGAGAAAGLCRSAKGQGSPLLLLLLLPPPLPPAAKGKRARARQWEPPGQRSRSLPCPALPCLQRGAERCGGTGRDGQGAGSWNQGSGSAAPARSLLRTGGTAGQPRPALALPSPRPRAAAEGGSLSRRITSGGRCPAGVLARPGDVRPPLGCPTCGVTLREQGSTAPPGSGRGAGTHLPGSGDRAQAGSTSSAQHCRRVPSAQLSPAAA